MKINHRLKIPLSIFFNFQNLVFIVESARKMLFAVLIKKELKEKNEKQAVLFHPLNRLTRLTIYVKIKLKKKIRLLNPNCQY